MAFIILSSIPLEFTYNLLEQTINCFTFCVISIIEEFSVYSTT